MAAVRTRTRVVQVTDQPTGPETWVATPEIKALAKDVFEANARKNAAGREESKAQKKLDVLMAKVSEGQAWGFNQKVGKDTVDADFVRGEKGTINVTTLFGLVDKDTFLRIVKATKGAVDDEAGNNISAACTDTVPGDWKAKVKARK